MQSSKEDESIPRKVAQKSYPKISKANWIREFASLPCKWVHPEKFDHCLEYYWILSQRLV